MHSHAHVYVRTTSRANMLVPLAMHMYIFYQTFPHRVNIPVGEAITMGTSVVPYLPPVPPKGTGFHRYVFSLYTHEEPLPTDHTHVGVASKGWLQQRLFSSSRFMSTQQVKPFTFCFFQSQWDRSVAHTYQHVLSESLPVPMASDM